MGRRRGRWRGQRAQGPLGQALALRPRTTIGGRVERVMVRTPGAHPLANAVPGRSEREARRPRSPASGGPSASSPSGGALHAFERSSLDRGAGRRRGPLPVSSRGRDGGSAGEPWLGAWTGAGGAVIGSLHRHIGDGARPFWPGVDRKGPPDPDDPSSLATPSSTPPPPPIVPHRPVDGAGREVDPAGSRRSTPRRLLEAIASFGRRISGVGHER